MATKSIIVALDNGSATELGLTYTGGAIVNPTEDWVNTPLGYANEYYNALTGMGTYLNLVEGESGSYYTSEKFYRTLEDSTLTFTNSGNALTYADIGYLKIYNPYINAYQVRLRVDTSTTYDEIYTITQGWNEIFIYERTDLPNPKTNVELAIDISEDSTNYYDYEYSASGTETTILRTMPIYIGQCTYTPFDRYLHNVFTSFDLTELYSVENTPSNSCTFTYVNDTNWSWSMDDSFKVFYDGEYYGTFYVNQMDSSSHDKLITIKGNDVFYTMGAKQTKGMVFDTELNCCYDRDITRPNNVNFKATLFEALSALCEEGGIDLDLSSVDNTTFLNGYHAKAGNSVRDEILKICLLQGKSPRVGRGTFSVETLGNETDYGEIDDYVFDGHTENAQDNVNNIAIRSMVDWNYNDIVHNKIKYVYDITTTDVGLEFDMVSDDWKYTNNEVIPSQISFGNWYNESKTYPSSENDDYDTFREEADIGSDGYTPHTSSEGVAIYTTKRGQTLDKGYMYRFSSGRVKFYYATEWSSGISGVSGAILVREFPSDTDTWNVEYTWTYTDANNDEHTDVYLEGIPSSSSVLTTIHNYYYKIKCWNRISFQTAMDLSTNGIFNFEGRDGLIEQVSHDLINGINSVNGYIEPF